MRGNSASERETRCLTHTRTRLVTPLDRTIEECGDPETGVHSRASTTVHREKWPRRFILAIDFPTTFDDSVRLHRLTFSRWCIRALSLLLVRANRFVFIVFVYGNQAGGLTRRDPEPVLATSATALQTPLYNMIKYYTADRVAGGKEISNPLSLFYHV